jgi:hypothetical protein
VRSALGMRVLDELEVVAAEWSDANKQWALNDSAERHLHASCFFGLGSQEAPRLGAKSAESSPR